jgi:hypothetical protein
MTKKKVPKSSVATSRVIKLKKQAQVTKEIHKTTTSNTDSGKASAELSNDPFIGKAVAFGMQSNFGLQLSRDLKDKFCPEAICYQLDKKHGHIVGTVIRCSKATRAHKAYPINYDVVWEFATLGESQVSCCLGSVSEVRRHDFLFSSYQGVIHIL